MAILDDIKSILVAGGMATGDIYLGSVPDAPNVGNTIIGLVEPGGGPPELAMGGVVAAEQTVIQAIIRGNQWDYSTTQATARTAYQILRNRVTETVNTVEYKHIRAVAIPFFIGYDDNDRPLFSLNIEVFREDV